MKKVLIHKGKMTNHSIAMKNSLEGLHYSPYETGNMPGCQSNSINQLRGSILNMVEGLEYFVKVTQIDAGRIERLGELFEQQDKGLGQRMQGLKKAK
ncbi:DUF3130 domain-containing protein [Listeria cossartiae]|uniref:DUF3130 family protein n=1 Tax=Listeria TaxID=1637 RepID=UPI0016257838|nr:MULTISPECIES: DUF3130 family protein [Listeria]MBC2119130.1 DUF3130 family protein [Listeria marthii]MBF2516287.1 DUF3130 family protein [Listeria marthii]MBF2518516.1 DUF3130 family protein [Listeria marthii]MCD2224651.1 DUF3130 domain-containing protein [Listeria cossartiae]MCD2239289.1 DUF3130 domain-containing protein [Listeria cossartiae]